jgi:acid phosphatase
MTWFLLLLAIPARAALPVVNFGSTGPTLRMVVAGDVGKGTARLAAGIARVHSKTPVDAIILTGDSFYPCGVVSVTDPRWAIVRPLIALGLPIFPILGNHDFCGRSDPDAQIRASAFISEWRFPARQYALHTGVADFAMLETTSYADGTNREAESAVREAFGSSQARWQIAVGHHSIVSSGWHGYFPRDEHARMRKLLPVLKDTGTDLYICGHDHHLELLRGQPLFLVSGAGSDPIPPIALHFTSLYPAEIRRQGGFAVLELTADAMAIRFHTLDGRSISEWYRFPRRRATLQSAP